MEPNKKQMELKLNDEGFTYVFETTGKIAPHPVSKFRRKIWQVFPSVCATFICVPFGLMVGWTSVNYPTLTDPDAPVFLTWDQTAMVAGFLMIGNTVGAPFSSLRVMGAKYGLMLSVTLMTIGWVLMWQAKDIFWLLGSRFLIGAGNGFGVGQLTYYINEICQESLAKFLTKQINLYVFASLILSFVFGPFVDFRRFSIVSTIITILVLFLTIFLPSTPMELVRSGKLTDARRLLAFLKPHLSVSEEMSKIKEKINSVDHSLSFLDIVKDSSLRKNFVIFAFLVFFQQFSGVPSTIVYSQVLFTRLHCPRPEFCALIYSFTYFIANVYGVYCIPKQNKKNVFLFSAVGVSLLLIVKIIVIVQKANDTFWGFTSLVVLLAYAVVHTIGLGTVPVSLIPELFPKEAKGVVVKFFVMFHSMLALTITKIFQVMFTNIGIFAPFCLFLVISTFSVIFVIVFVPNKNKSVNS